MDYKGRNKELVERHVESLAWMRESLLCMDPLARPLMGIKDWDDAVIVPVGDRRIVASTDGPYKKRLVMKSALVHAATDVIVKGGKPMFALDNLFGSEEDVREMMGSLRKQALALELPVLGGNTMVGEGEPTCSITVIGELVVPEPIRDSGAKRGDVALVIGESIWGEMDERLEKAKTLFRAWYLLLESGIRIDAAKDVTKGGLVSAVYEVCKKSGVEYELRKDVPFSCTRNLDNFLVFVPGSEVSRLEEVCRKASCPVSAVAGAF